MLIVLLMLFVMVRGGACLVSVIPYSCLMMLSVVIRLTFQCF